MWHRLRNDWSRRYADAGDSAREVVNDGRAAVRLAAGVPTATLPRLRHTVATFLVSQGKILEAQDRLGHGDASTTVREYSHVLPGREGVVADGINDFLDVTQISNADLLL